MRVSRRHSREARESPLQRRLVVDEPTDLPEGTEIELLPLDPGDRSIRKIELRSIRPSRIPTRISKPVVSSTRM